MLARNAYAGKLSEEKRERKPAVTWWMSQAGNILRREGQDASKRRKNELSWHRGKKKRIEDSSINAVMPQGGTGGITDGRGPTKRR